jgi:type VI secretion system secreted protein Hcp
MEAQEVAQHHLKIIEIPGEARSKSHPGEIELWSWTWGEVQSGSFNSESKNSGGNLAMRDFEFVALSGQASVNLMLYCACGKPLKSAVLTCEMPKPGGGSHTYLTVTLTKVMVSSYEVELEENSDQPFDKFQLKFEKVEFKHIAMKADGSPAGQSMASWNLASNQE